MQYLSDPVGVRNLAGDQVLLLLDIEAQSAFPSFPCRLSVLATYLHSHRQSRPAYRHMEPTSSTTIATTLSMGATIPPNTAMSLYGFLNDLEDLWYP